jgi:cell fate regulator YaaT (PSP1 superfamily)
MEQEQQNSIEQQQQDREQRALAKCKELVTRLGLNMRPLVAQYSPENRRMTICFRAEERVDFRKLVRELGRSLKARVELRQVGPRDQGKLVGHIGVCGYPLCCQTFLKEYTPASIKMAKQQNLVLNPTKISGICGRLLCCLSYERGQYTAIKERMPRVGHEVITPLGKATVVAISPIKETVSVQFHDQTIKDIPLDQITREKKEQKQYQQTEGKEEEKEKVEP